ncbi:MAG: DUF6104 family protein [Acidimicrobiales bacterium]
MTSATNEDAPGTAARKQGLEESLAGVRALRERRGDEQVRFSQVADHLVDFTAHRAGTEQVVDDLARFLSEVEDTGHDHDAEAGSAGA